MAAQAVSARETQTMRAKASEGFTLQELVASLQKLLTEKPELKDVTVSLADGLSITGPAREIEADSEEKRIIIG